MDAAQVPSSCEGLKKGDKIRMTSTGRDWPVGEVGIFTPLRKETGILRAGDVAVARMQPEWVMEGMQCTEPFVVTMAIPMDYELMMRMDEYGRDLRAGVHVIQKYNDGTSLARLGANWLRERGFHAFGYCGPASGKFTSIPAALNRCAAESWSRVFPLSVNHLL